METEKTYLVTEYGIKELKVESRGQVVLRSNVLGVKAFLQDDLTQIKGDWSISLERF